MFCFETWSVFFYSQKCQQWLNTHFGTTIGFKFRWSTEVIQKIWKDFYVHGKVIFILRDRHFFLTAAEKKITRFGDLVVTSVEVLSLILLKFYIMKWLFHCSLSDNEYCFLSRVKKKMGNNIWVATSIGWRYFLAILFFLNEDVSRLSILEQKKKEH